MTIAILILTHILLLDDIICIFSGKNSNLLLTSALNTLLAWQVNQTWGIVYLCVLSVLTISGIIFKTIND